MRLQALAILAGAALVAPLDAQTARTSRSADLLAAPGGRPVATLTAGTDVRRGAARGAFTEVTVEGFVSASLLAGAREQFPLSVRANLSGARLRASPSTSAAIVAEMRGGMGLNQVSRSGDWVRVRRTGWVATRALPPAAPAAVAAAAPAASGAAGRDTLPRDTAAGGVALPATAAAAEAGALTPAVGAVLRTAPEGDSVGSVEPGARLTALARERGWIRVRVEGWMREGDVIPADTALRISVSAADLRADPEGSRGMLVRWNVQVIALQTADPLRRDLRPEEPYLLARGPGSENALLYLAVPPALLEQARSLPPLSMVAMTARVRTGRSDPVGVPILDLLTLSRAP